MSATRPLVAFVHIAKTAGSSTKFILRNSLGLAHCNVMTLEPGGSITEEDLRFACRVFPGLRSISGHTLENPAQRLSTPMRCFTLLRDPLARTASHFQQNRRHRLARGQDITFDAYIDNPKNWNRQVKKIAGRPDLEAAKAEIARSYFFVGLMEDYQRSMTMLGRLHPERLDLRYPRLHVARDNTDKKAVLADPGTRRRLEEANLLDLELHAWVRDELYPAYLRDVVPERAAVQATEVPRLPLPWRATLNRWWSLGIYRTLMKRRRRRHGAQADGPDGEPEG